MTVTSTADSLSHPKLCSKGTSGRRAITTQPRFQVPLKQHVIWKCSSLSLTSILEYFQQSCQALSVTFFGTSGEHGDPPGPADATPQHCCPPPLAASQHPIPNVAQRTVWPGCEVHTFGKITRNSVYLTGLRPENFPANWH